MAQVIYEENSQRHLLKSRQMQIVGANESENKTQGECYDFRDTQLGDRGSQVTRTTVVHQFHYWQSVVDEAGLHILLHPGIQDARKWIENEKMKKRKWRMNEEMDRE